MEGEGKKRKNGIELDWDQLLGELGNYGEEEEPLPLEVVTKNTPLKGPPVTVELDEEYSQRCESLKGWKEEAIHSAIDSSKYTLLHFKPKLKDGGAKLRNQIKLYEDELEHRKSVKVQKTSSLGLYVKGLLHAPEKVSYADHLCFGAMEVGGILSFLKNLMDLVNCYIKLVLEHFLVSYSPFCCLVSLSEDLLWGDGDGCNKPIHSQTKSCFNIDISDDFQEVAPTLLPSTKSSVFASRFCNKMDQKEELCTSKQRDSGKLRSKGISSRGRKKRGAFSREAPSVSNGSLFVDVDKQMLSSIDRKDGYLAACSHHNSSEDFPSLSAAKRTSDSRFQNLHWQCNKGDPVVLDDEDEIEVKEITPSPDVIDDCTDKDTRIYYPSRDDPEAIEICFTDLQCLDPEAYLSSTIMNFYIRFMWGQIPTDRERYNYHFFNTYFYEKLKEAVQPGSSKETSFTKFRRWWKGVNIFEKAYILLPIHDHLHWSLVVICIPDREDRLGPVLLHLDSLGLHHSDPIFKNIKKFLIGEWEYLNEREVQMDLPLQDAVWEKLPRRIKQKVLEVPRQGNDYDCGLFVLYFMKRFIEEAPERLKMDDPSNILHKIGRKWFSPLEPSVLRQEIRTVLKQLFKDASY